MHVGVPSVPCPPLLPLAVFERAKLIPLVPPASAMYPVTVRVPFAPSAEFSGVSGCRKPGVMVRTVETVVVGLEVSAAVMVT